MCKKSVQNKKKSICFDCVQKKNLYRLCAKKSICIDCVHKIIYIDCVPQKYLYRLCAKKKKMKRKFQKNNYTKIPRGLYNECISLTSWQVYIMLLSINKNVLHLRY